MNRLSALDTEPLHEVGCTHESSRAMTSFCVKVVYNTIQYNTIHVITLLHSGTFAYSELQTSIYNFQNVLPLQQAKIR